LQIGEKVSPIGRLSYICSCIMFCLDHKS
jgi:hypothetical protein